MLFWILTVCLFVLAALFVLVPLFRGGAVAADSEDLRVTANVALYEERLSDLQGEFDAGNLDQEQFDKLVLELKQSLLADVDQQAGSGEQGRSDNKPEAAAGRAGLNLSLAVPLVMSLLIPLSAYLLYQQWGYIDDVRLMDLFQRTVDNVDDAQEAQQLIVALGETVQDDPEQTWAWYFLAENLAAVGLFNEAEIGYRRAADLLPDTRERALVLGRVAMAMYINAEFRFTPEILEVVQEAREINPNELSILQLLATDAAERQDYQAAIQYWRLLIQANPNTEQANILRANVAAAQQILRDQDPDAASGPGIDVNIRLADGLELADNLRIFVAARNAAREGMPPLAAVDLTVANLPTTVRLDNSSAVGPFNLSSADSVYVSALVSYAGTATPQSGDYRVVSDSFEYQGDNAVIDLVITERVP